MVAAPIQFVILAAGSFMDGSEAPGYWGAPLVLHDNEPNVSHGESKKDA